MIRGEPDARLRREPFFKRASTRSVYETPPMLRKPRVPVVAVLVSLASSPTIRAADQLRALSTGAVMPGVRDYGFLWWADGWRGRSENGGKVLRVRTGYYGFALDVERLRLTHFGAIKDATPAEQAVAEDNATVTNLPAADLAITVELGGVTYRLVGVDSHAKDALDFPVRLIESGRGCNDSIASVSCSKTTRRNGSTPRPGWRSSPGRTSCRSRSR